MNTTIKLTALKYFYLWRIFGNNDSEIIKPVKQQITFGKLKLDKSKYKNDTDLIDYIRNELSETFELTMSLDELWELHDILRSIETFYMTYQTVSYEHFKEISDFANEISDIIDEIAEKKHPETEPLNQVQNDNIKLIA